MKAPIAQVISLQCLSLVGNLRSIEQMFCDRYPGLFMKGFDKTDWCAEFEGGTDSVAWAVMPCLHDSTKLQINTRDLEVLESGCKDHNVTPEDKAKLTRFFSKARMSADEVRDYLITSRPALNHLFEVWKETRMSQLTLTTVGVAIAQANFRRRTGEQLDLSIWVK